MPNKISVAYLTQLLIGNNYFRSTMVSDQMKPSAQLEQYPELFF